MKLSLLFLFALLMPFTIFLTELLYGGTSPEILKKNLRESTIYKTVSEFIINAEAEGPQGEKSKKISMLIYQRFTPEYVQIKTEKLIDDSAIWITKNGPAPVVSFVDIKEDLINSNPEFRTVLQELPKEFTEENIKEYSGEEAFSELTVDPQSIQPANSITALAQNDFVVPVGDYFDGMKTFYSVIRIVHPVLVGVLILLLFLIWKLGENLPTKLRWIGSASITAAIFGLGMIFFNSVAVKHLAEVTQSSSDNFLATFSPIMLQLMNGFMKQYSYFQLLTSSILFVLGAISFIASKTVKQPSTFSVIRPIKK